MAAATYREISTATGTSVSPAGALPSGSVAGDLLLAAVSNIEGTPAAITGVPSGWTLLQEGITAGGGKNVQTAVYAKAANSAAGPFTWTLSSDDPWSVHIVAIANAGAIVSTKSINDAASLTMTAPSVTAERNGVLVCFYGRSISTATAITAVLDERGDTQGLYTATGTIAAAGATGTKAATASESTRAAMVSVAVGSTLVDNMMIGSL